MKKTYMIPTMQVVKIQPAHLMVNSIPEAENPYGSGDPVLSRRARFSEWDEEE